jgi:hypothetical protein
MRQYQGMCSLHHTLGNAEVSKQPLGAWQIVRF